MIECSPVSMGHSGAALDISSIPNNANLINLKNIPDNQCFVYALIAALKHEEAQKGRRGGDATNAQCKTYRDFAAQLDFSETKFPMDNQAIEAFLRKNQHVLDVVVHIYTVFDSKLTN